MHKVSRDEAISIHTSREGGDPADYFQTIIIDISIHTSREGGDYTGMRIRDCAQHFNPHLPRGR